MQFLNRLFGGATSGHQLSVADYLERYATTKGSHTLVDVRTPGEFAEGTIPGALNIELGTLETQLKKIPTDKPVVLFCRSGNRSGMAVGILAQHGYGEVYNLGGVGGWVNAGKTLVKPRK
jgi:phage shock protein E